MIIIFGGQRKLTFKSRFHVKIKCAMRERCFTAQCGHTVIQTAKYNNITKSDFSFFFVSLPGPTGMAHRFGHQPDGQLHLRPGQQRCAADHREQTGMTSTLTCSGLRKVMKLLMPTSKSRLFSGSNRGGPSHALPGTRYRVHSWEEGGADHAGGGHGHRLVLQRRPLHRRDRRKENPPHSTGNRKRRLGIVSS